MPGDPTLRSTAEALDAADPLKDFKAEFYIGDPDQCYLDGNSLGRLPLDTQRVVAEFLAHEWG